MPIEPLNYQPPAEQPPKMPLAWMLIGTVGLVASIFHPHLGGIAGDLVDFFVILICGGLGIYGGIRMARWLGEMQDYQYKLGKRGSTDDPKEK